MDIILMGRGRLMFSPANPAECAINVTSASHNLRQLRYENIGTVG